MYFSHSMNASKPWGQAQTAYAYAKEFVQKFLHSQEVVPLWAHKNWQVWHDSCPSHLKLPTISLYGRQRAWQVFDLPVVASFRPQVSYRLRARSGEGSRLSITLIISSSKITLDGSPIQVLNILYPWKSTSNIHHLLHSATEFKLLLGDATSQVTKQKHGVVFHFVIHYTLWLNTDPIHWIAYLPLRLKGGYTTQRRPTWICNISRANSRILWKLYW